MKTQNQKKPENRTSGVNPIAAALTGVVVGASVAVAGVTALSDEKNREKVKKVFTDLKSQAIGYIDEKQKQEQTTEGTVSGKLLEGKEKVKMAKDSAKEALQEDVKDAKKVVDKSVKRGI